MKITFTIEIEDGEPPKVTVKLPKAEKPEPPIIIRPPKLAKIADAPAPPLPPEPTPDAPKPAGKPGSGPQFAPEFLACIRNAPEPFTRRAIAVVSGLAVGDVTLRLNRMKHHGWITQPAPGLWQRTNTFAERTP